MVRLPRRAPVVAAITWTMDCILDGLVAYGEAMYSGLCEPTGEAPDRRDPAGPLSSRRR